MVFIWREKQINTKMALFGTTVRKGTLLQMSVFTEVFISRQESRHVKGRLLEDGANVILFVESQSNIF